MSYPITLQPVGRLLSPLNHSSLYHLVAAAANNAFDLHKKVLIVGEHEVPQSTSPCCLLYHLGEEIVFDGLWNPLDCLCPGYVPPVDIRVVEKPHEDQSYSRIPLLDQNLPIEVSSTRSFQSGSLEQTFPCLF